LLLLSTAAAHAIGIMRLTARSRDAGGISRKRALLYKSLVGLRIH
jgi:hypothetical protein